MFTLSRGDFKPILQKNINLKGGHSACQTLSRTVVFPNIWHDFLLLPNILSLHTLYAHMFIVWERYEILCAWYCLSLLYTFANCLTICTCHALLKQTTRRVNFAHFRKKRDAAQQVHVSSMQATDNRKYSSIVSELRSLTLLSRYIVRFFNSKRFKASCCCW